MFIIFIIYYKTIIVKTKFGVGEQYSVFMVKLYVSLPCAYIHFPA